MSKIEHPHFLNYLSKDLEGYTQLKMNLFPNSLLKLIFSYSNTTTRSISLSTTFEDLKWYEEIVQQTTLSVEQQAILLKKCCEVGNLNLIKNLHAHYGMVKDDVLIFTILAGNDKIKCIFDNCLLSLVCQYNHFNIFTWFIEEFKITKEELTVNDGMLLNIIAGRCDPNFVKYYLTLYEHPSTNRLLFAFMEACRTGNLNNCKLIFSMCDRNHIIGDEIYSRLLTACFNGHILVAEFITDELSLDVYLSRAHIESIFAEVCITGRLKVIKWFVKKFNIKPEDFSKDNYYLATRIRRSGKLKTIRWVINFANGSESV